MPQLQAAVAVIFLVATDSCATYVLCLVRRRLPQISAVAIVRVKTAAVTLATV